MMSKPAITVLGTLILKGPAGDRGEQGPPGMHGFQVSNSHNYFMIKVQT